MEGGTKGKSKSKGKKADDSHRCFHCHMDGARLRCSQVSSICLYAPTRGPPPPPPPTSPTTDTRSQCKRAWFCGRACQKKHWREHKRACVAAVAADARRATRVREATAARRGDGGGSWNDECVICAAAPVVAPVERQEASCVSLAEAVFSLADSPQ